MWCDAGRSAIGRTNLPLGRMASVAFDEAILVTYWAEAIQCLIEILFSLTNLQK